MTIGENKRRFSARAVCVGVSRWKRSAASAMLETAEGKPLFARSVNEALRIAVQHKGFIAVWASRPYPHLAERAAALGVPVVRLEDGFIRSVGLGAAFVPPASLVADSRGIYYDPRSPSDLEHFLCHVDISRELTERGGRLRQSLLTHNLTKYNVGCRAAPALVPAGRRGVLVPGQVEDDASIRFGSPIIRTNLALLEAARARHRDAFIIYKPHPDVAAGYRVGAVSPADTARLANATVTDRSITALYEECNHVETMTSLAGFEALLRGLSVTTHGQPFYAGWGLTEDLLPHPRRGRKRSLDELVAATLILYPLYIHPHTGQRCDPEDVLAVLAREVILRKPFRSALQHFYARSRHGLLGGFDRWRRR
jgi:capsular polysaccharide export protein